MSKSFGTPFRKGETGNPGGRPKGIALKAREHGDRALEVLVEALDDADSRVRIAAAKEILDRGYGKSALTVEVPAPRRVTELSDAELMVIASGVGEEQDLPPVH